MPKVTFVAADGQRFEVDATEGLSLMRAAVENDIPGIDADCGGACACATCHVYVADEWLSVLPAAQSGEIDLLECTDEPTAASRLSCQIMLDASLDGLVVAIPTSQN